MYQLHAAQSLSLSRDEAWNFLSDPANLKVITPDSMGFHILSGASMPMYQGQIIQYLVSPFPGIKTRWVTEITHVKEGEYFVDEQRFGPYALWHHKHFLEAIDGGVLMQDIIDYKLPLGFFGRLFHTPLVKSQLQKIFKYRAAKLDALFGEIPGSTTSLSIKAI